MQAADRGLRDVLVRTYPESQSLEAHRVRGYTLAVRLIERLQAQGSLRPDLVPEDLVLIPMANAGVVEAVGDAAGRVAAAPGVAARWPPGRRRVTLAASTYAATDAARDAPLP